MAGPCEQLCMSAAYSITPCRAVSRLCTIAAFLTGFSEAFLPPVLLVQPQMPSTTLMSVRNALTLPVHPSHIGCVICRILAGPYGCGSAAGGLLRPCCLPRWIHAGVDDQRDADEHDDAPDHADPDVPVVVQVRSIGANDGVCKAQKQRQASRIVMCRGPPPPAGMR